MKERPTGRMLCGMGDERSVQDRFFEGGICFGCGPANDRGLRIKSFPRSDGVDGLWCRWRPQPHHAAYEGMLSGGIVGTLLDCHSNWTAAWHLMQVKGADRPPTTVTAEFCVKLRKPTPMDEELLLQSEVVHATDRKVVVHATLAASSGVTASCEGTFVAVPEGHPAFGRW